MKKYLIIQMCFKIGCILIWNNSKQIGLCRNIP